MWFQISDLKDTFKAYPMHKFGKYIRKNRIEKTHSRTHTRIVKFCLALDTTFGIAYINSKKRKRLSSKTEKKKKQVKNKEE